MQDKRHDWIYDLETYPNIFTMCVVRDDKKEAFVFEISDRKDQSKEMRSFLKRLYNNKDRMVGFNNLGFDYIIIHEFLRSKSFGYNEAYDLASDIIGAMKQDDRFAFYIPEHKHFIQQVDLFKIHHFDNKARMTSLKMIEFNMRSNTIEDLPFEVGTELNDEQKDILIHYNKHDVKETLKFYYESLTEIKFREDLSVKYKKNFINFNDTKIGKEYFIDNLEKALPGSCYDYSTGRRQLRQSKRPDGINLGEVVFDYINFERDEFKAVVNWLNNQTIKQTKGVFTDILESDLGEELASFSNLRTKRQRFNSKPQQRSIDKFLREKPLGWIEEKTLKSKKVSYWKNWNVADNLNVVVDGFQFDFGTGGIHGSIPNCIFKSDDEYIIKDLDVASYYPNLAISNNLFPEHLSKNFCDIYLDVYNQRKEFPKKKFPSENKMLKLALNGVYGDSNNKFSPFYDPKYTMSITINGQLLLCLLAERLMKINDLTLIQVNTDGLTVKIKRSELSKLYEVTEWWQKLTKLELEEADYSAMYIRDCNNYIAVYTNGDVKRKGAYQYSDLGWHQNQSMLVVPKAVEHKLLGRGEIRDFIINHDDPWDFMLRTKVPRSSRLVSVDDDGNETLQQNICRYYACTTGEYLVKIMPPLPKEPDKERRIGIDSGWKVKICNDFNRDFDGNIDYEYYIEAANKLVNPILGID